MMETGENSGPVHNKFPKHRQHYIKDLKETPIHRPQVLVWIPSLTYLVYIQRVLKNIIVTLMFEWTMPLFQPVDFLLLVTIFPTLIIGIILLEIGLQIGLKFGLGDLIQNFSDKWGNGYSLVNWWDPRIFESDVDEVVKRAVNALSSPLPKPLPESQLDDSIFGIGCDFNLDIAELLLFMSSLIYEREDNDVLEAKKLIHQVAKESNESILSGKVNCITELLVNSEKRISDQASKWGLEFTSLSELNSLGGPFSGMFWSNQYNFIVVVFKGTTPSNFEDFVVDFMLQKVDARSYVFGGVHEGFYTSLFPQISHSTSRSSPYIATIRAIRAKAADIRASRPENEREKINVWVTGHSLGAALAGLFYARLVKAPEDLGKNCILRGGYTFGCPRIGDADFASEFASYNNVPYDKQGTLWRVIDDFDIITKIPFGLNDQTARYVVNKNSTLNYVHIGEAIKFFQNGDRPVCTRNLFSSGKEPAIIERSPGSFDFLKRFKRKRESQGKENSQQTFKKYEHKPGSPLIIIERLIPTFFKNHIPASYYAAMEKARKHFDGPTIENENFNNAVKKFSEKHLYDKMD